MKTIILVRHGKSSWDYSVNDKDRPLQEKGIGDAHLVGSSLKALKLQIDAAFSSPANRALHTCMIVLRQLQFPLDALEINDRLYDFSGDEVQPFIKELDNQYNTVMLFGHNHAFTHIANLLGNTYIDNVPTSGLVELQFAVDHWRSITKGITKHTIFPKMLRE